MHMQPLTPKTYSNTIRMISNFHLFTFIKTSLLLLIGYLCAWLCQCNSLLSRVQERWLLSFSSKSNLELKQLLQRKYNILELVFRGKWLHMHALFDTLRCFKGIGRELSIKGQKLKNIVWKSVEDLFGLTNGLEILLGFRPTVS